MKKYSHLMDVGFTVESEKENYEDLTYEELVAGVARRLRQLRTNDEGLDSFGYSDTIILEDE